MPESLDSKLLGVKEGDPSWTWLMEEARILKMHHLWLFLLHLLWSKCRGFVSVCSSDISCHHWKHGFSVCILAEGSPVERALSTHSLSSPGKIPSMSLIPTQKLTGSHVCSEFILCPIRWVSIPGGSLLGSTSLRDLNLSRDLLHLFSLDNSSEYQCSFATYAVCERDPYIHADAGSELWARCLKCTPEQMILSSVRSLCEPAALLLLMMM